MRNIKFIKDSSEINQSKEWIESEKFHNFGRVVNRNGDPIGKDAKGRRFRLIAKMERAYTFGERVGRSILGVITVISSLGMALFSLTIRELFYGTRKVIRYAQPISSKSRIFSTNSLDFPSDMKTKVMSSMEKVVKHKESKGIIYYESQKSHLVFELKCIPNILFKMASKPLKFDQSMIKRYRCMQKARDVCRKYGLEQLVIPDAKLFNVEFNGRNYDVIAEEKLDINTAESVQEQSYYDYASSLTEAISQLAVFICKTGYSDVEWRNNPVLNNSLENGNRKIALLDLEETHDKLIGLWGSIDPKRRGLIGCINLEQAKIVHKIAKWNGISTEGYFRSFKQRQKELENHSELKQFYQNKNIVDGKEPINPDVVESLNLDLSEVCEYRQTVFEKGTLRSKKVKITLGEVAKAIVASINESLKSSSKQGTIKSKRQVFLDMNTERLTYYKRLGLPQGKVFPNDDENKQKWPRRIIQALIDKGYAFELLHDFGNEYIIQL